jgi:hypothetical protein
MIRTLVVVFAGTGAVAVTLSQAYAQSPDPALLAPGSSRSVLTPRPSIPHTGGATTLRRHALRGHPSPIENGWTKASWKKIGLRGDRGRALPAGTQIEPPAERPRARNA